MVDDPWSALSALNQLHFWEGAHQAKTLICDLCFIFGWWTKLSHMSPLSHKEAIQIWEYIRCGDAFETSPHCATDGREKMKKKLT